MAYRYVVLAIVALLAGACGSEVEGDQNEVDTTTTDAESPSTSSTSVAITTTTVTVLGVRAATEAPQYVVDELNEFAAGWTTDCDSSVVDATELTVTYLVRWDPEFRQSLGAYDGPVLAENDPLDSEWLDQCSIVGTAIRSIDTFDDRLPTGDAALALAGSPGVDAALDVVAWVGVHYAEPLAPEHTDRAPAPPEWAPDQAGTCDELQGRLHGYFKITVESLNALSPLQSVDWEAYDLGDPASDGVGDRAWGAVSATVEQSSCERASLLRAALDGAVEADAISFVAEATKWGLIGAIREALVTEVLGDPHLSIESGWTGEETTHILVLKNSAQTPVIDVAIQLVGVGSDNPFAPGDTLWSSDLIASGETVTVDSGTSVDADLPLFISWREEGEVLRNLFWEVGAIIVIEG